MFFIKSFSKIVENYAQMTPIVLWNNEKQTEKFKKLLPNQNNINFLIHIFFLIFNLELKYYFLIVDLCIFVCKKI